MSDPTSIGSVLQSRVNSNTARENARPNAQIVEISRNVERGENNSRTERIRGKVSRVERNNTITVKTDRGDIKVKANPNVAVQNGDAVEVRIDTSISPPISANITPIAQQPETLAPRQTQPLALPPALSSLELINGAPITVTPLPPQNTATIIQPYSEIINATLPALETTAFTIATALPSDTSLLILSAPDIPAPALDISTPFAATGDTSELNTILTRTETTLPFRSIAVQFISAPEPLTINIIGQTETPPPLIAEINIQNIQPPRITVTDPNQPLTPLTHIPHQHITNAEARIGETKAVFVGITADRHFPVLHIPSAQHDTPALYTLQAPFKDIPIGAQLEISVTKTTVLPLIPPLFGQSFILSPQSWPVLQDIASTLAQIAPQTAAAFQATLPNPAAPQQLAPTALFFIAAMRSGDIQNWLGERAVDALKTAGKGGLIEQFSREINALSRETTAQDWRSLSLPMAWQNDIHKIILHYRKEDGSHNDDDENSGNKTRFVLDLNLSNMGKIQLDALFIGASEKRLDLILRSEESFSAAMKQQMRTSYKSALDETSITGELSFQHHLDSWVKITIDKTPDYTEDV